MVSENLYYIAKFGDVIVTLKYVGWYCNAWWMYDLMSQFSRPQIIVINGAMGPDMFDEKWMVTTRKMSLWLKTASK